MILRSRSAAAIAALTLALGVWCAASPAPSRAADNSAAPQLFTSQQASAGKAIYEASCTACHGAKLQGVSAPPLVGSGFTSGNLTLGQMHTIVTTEMPFDNPGSLKPDQYAAVIAYLLAANCYPAGTSAYPADGDKAHANLKIATQGNGQLCEVK